jgi:hypothetical protein
MSTPQARHIGLARLVRSGLRVVAGMLLCATALATPVELSGVKLGDPIQLGSTSLQLNGAGIRHKAVFKVYVAALYLATKAATPEEAYAAAGPRRLVITLLRDIDSDVLATSMTEAFENNTPAAEKLALATALARLRQVFMQERVLRSGQTITIDWIPETGTVLSIHGVPRGEPFKGREFFNALLRAWLGPRPADGALKDTLLGKSQ